MPDTLLKPQAAADYLGLSADFLEKKRMTGGGPEFVVLSRKAIRYRRSALDRFVESRTVTDTAGARRILDDMNQGDGPTGEEA
jgi:hypothetical protein